MKILDITVDLETLALTPNAAIMQIAAVAWQRDAEDTPFFLTHWKDEDGTEHSKMADHYIFDNKIDLRSCVALNMDFDQKTVAFWSTQKPEVKHAVLYSEDCDYVLSEALNSFMAWAAELASELDEKGCSIRLWCQGSDFDIALLRNAAAKCGLTEEFDRVFPHTSFRDARTFTLEIGRAVTYPFFPLADRNDVKPSSIYQALPPFEGSNLTHDARYDCLKTTWAVWNVMREHAKQYAALNCMPHAD